MPTYEVISFKRADLNPGDVYARLEVQHHSGFFFFYKKFVPGFAALRPFSLLATWWKKGPGGVMYGKLVEADNPDDLRAKVFGMEWGK